jgi:aspartate/methionine/tyrosine aminotransferase
VSRLAKGAAALRKGVFAALEERIAEVARAGKTLVPLHIGDTHVLPPPEAREALVREDAALFRYGPTGGLPALREALAGYVTARRGYPVRADEVLLGAGGTHALHCVARVLLDPGDEVVLLSPYWPLAPGIFEAQGATCVEVPVDLGHAPLSAEGLRARLDQAIGPRTRAIYFVSPGNPDGAIFGPELLTVIHEVARGNDLWVLADEVYADVTYERPHVAFRAAVGPDASDDAARRTVSLYSFSKSFALAGQRVGFAVAPPAVVAAALRISTHTVFNVPVASQNAALAALASPSPFLEATRASYVQARDAVASALSAAGVVARTPEAGVYFFVDLGPHLGARSLSDVLLRGIDEGVLVAPGPAFGAGYETRVRLCFTSVPRDRTASGVAALLRALTS